MVTETSFTERINQEGMPFITLELTGGLELIQSQTTGKHYATVRKCSIPSTFDANIAQSLIGTQLEGNIVRIECEPYEYVKKGTGEVMILNYNYAYQDNSKNLVGLTPVQEFIES